MESFKQAAHYGGYNFSYISQVLLSETPYPSVFKNTYRFTTLGTQLLLLFNYLELV